MREPFKSVNARQAETYGQSSLIYGATTRGMLYSDVSRQHARYEEILGFLPKDDALSILDFGCGIGDFYNFLRESGFRGHYEGCDLVPSFVERAKARFPNATFSTITEDQVPDTSNFDFVIICGVFNVNVGQTLDWVHEILSMTFRNVRRGLIFNAISSHVTYRDSGMFYCDPAEMLDFCISNLSPKVQLSHGHPPYNFTIRVSVLENETAGILEV